MIPIKICSIALAILVAKALSIFQWIATFCESLLALPSVPIRESLKTQDSTSKSKFKKESVPARDYDDDVRTSEIGHWLDGLGEFGK